VIEEVFFGILLSLIFFCINTRWMDREGKGVILEERGCFSFLRMRSFFVESSFLGERESFELRSLFHK
jgi:hypothetical protein